MGLRSNRFAGEGFGVRQLGGDLRLHRLLVSLPPLAGRDELFTAAAGSRL